MKKEIKHPDKVLDTGAYSAGVLSEGLLFISGQGLLDLTTGKVIRGTIEEETLLTLAHILNIEEASGGTIDNILNVPFT